MTPRRVLVAGFALAVAIIASSARAHTGGSTGHAAITVEGASVRYHLTLWPSTMSSAVAEELRLARDGSVASRDRLLDVVRDKVTLAAEGVRCAAGVGSLAPSAPGVESVTLVLEFSCAGAVRDLLVRDDIFDAFGADHHTIGRIDALGSTTPFAFAPDTREIRLTLGGSGAGRGLASFVGLGVEHILTGWDHLLFLLALLLHGGGLVAMVKIVTAFTARSQRHPVPRRARRRRPAVAPGRGGHRAVHRRRGRRESLRAAHRHPALGGERLLRPRAWIRFFVGPTRARAAHPRPPALAVRVQCRRRAGSGVRGGGGLARARDPAPDELGEVDDPGRVQRHPGVGLALFVERTMC